MNVKREVITCYNIDAIDSCTPNSSHLNVVSNAEVYQPKT